MSDAHEPKFTAGGWFVGPYALSVESPNPYGHGLMKVCDIRGWGHLTGKGCCGLDFDEAERIQRANGNLIAAAPTMYAALKAAMTFTHHRDTCTHCRANGLCRDGNDLLGVSLDLRNAALAQARGEDGGDVCTK